MKEIIVIALTAAIVITLLLMSSQTTVEGKTVIIESDEIFDIQYETLHKGKEIFWDCEVEQGHPEPKPALLFWIEDSNGTKYNEIESSKEKGSFTVPYTDTWTLNWENPYPEDSDHFALKLTYAVEVVNQPPIASIDVNITSGPVPLIVSFTGTAVDYDGVITAYLWDFGEGNASTIQNPAHTFTKNGRYPVVLTVIDNNGAIGMDTITISVRNLTNLEKMYNPTYSKKYHLPLQISQSVFSCISP